MGVKLAALEDRPKVVCLCGSTRFYDEFQQANYDLTMRGEIVLTVGFYPHAKATHGHGEGVGHDSAEKVALDELHKRKIDLADYVYVLNIGGYIGQSTRSEIEYALAHGKTVVFAEPWQCLETMMINGTEAQCKEIGSNHTIHRFKIDPESTLATPKPTPRTDEDTDRKPSEGYAGSTTQLASDIARTNAYGHAIQPPRVANFEPREAHLPRAGEISLKWRATS